MSIVVISNALVMSRRTGESSAGGPKLAMHISEKVYDPEYPNRLRFNNYWVTAHGDLAERVIHMGIKERSSVNLTCRMDFMKSVKQTGDAGEGDGRSRFVRGLLFELLDISFAAGTENGEPKTDNGKKEENTSSEEVPVINLDEDNILMEKTVPKGRVYGGTIR